jgi:tRNA pseudouridine38-40 synthase
LENNAPGLNATNTWAWSVAGPLDLAAMNRAGEVILGTHDFRAFCRRPSNSVAGEPLLRKVLLAHWDRIDDQWAMSPRHVPVLRLTIRAQSFCHNMVRCLVSSMVAIGRGALDENEIAKRLESGDRHQLPQPAPAAGLALIDVGYDDA